MSVLQLIGHYYFILIISCLIGQYALLPGRNLLPDESTDSHYLQPVQGIFTGESQAQCKLITVCAGQDFPVLLSIGQCTEFARLNLTLIVNHH